MTEDLLTRTYGVKVNIYEAEKEGKKVKFTTVCHPRA
jgi:hypothetical protein